MQKDCEENAVNKNIKKYSKIMGVNKMFGFGFDRFDGNRCGCGGFSGCGGFDGCGGFGGCGGFDGGCGGWGGSFGGFRGGFRGGFHGRRGRW